jgi:hypothetical protein
LAGDGVSRKKGAQMNKLKMSICLAMSLIYCSHNPTSNTDIPATKVLLPLEVGKTWAYQCTTRYDDSVVAAYQIISRISSLVTGVSGYPLYEWKDSVNDSSVSYDYYEKRADGVYLYASTPGGYHVLLKSIGMQPGVQTRLKSLLVVPDSFSTGEEVACDTIIDTVTNDTAILKRKYVGTQTVNSGIGSVNCHVFETNGYWGRRCLNYYSYGIGLVQKEEIIDSFPITFVDTNLIMHTRVVASKTKEVLRSIR